MRTVGLALIKAKSAAANISGNPVSEAMEMKIRRRHARGKTPARFFVLAANEPWTSMPDGNSAEAG